MCNNINLCKLAKVSKSKLVCDSGPGLGRTPDQDPKDAPDADPEERFRHRSRSNLRVQASRQIQVWVSKHARDAGFAIHAGQRPRGTLQMQPTNHGRSAGFTTRPGHGP